MAEYPAEMTPALREILSMCFWHTRPVADALREAGQEIAHKAEAEQAAAMHFLIPLAIEHGENWHAAAIARLKEIAAAAKNENADD